MKVEKKLELLQKYGEKAFTDVARSSSLRGKELCGYVYSPYLFRRWIGTQLEKAVALGGMERGNLFYAVCKTMSTKWLREELSTLAVLEKSSPSIFEERSQFLPLSVVSRIAEMGFVNYEEAAKFEFPRNVLEDIELCECYVRAGIFYRERNRIAFGGGSVEEFERARIEIPKWDVAQMEAYLQTIADECVRKWG